VLCESLKIGEEAVQASRREAAVQGQQVRPMPPGTHLGNGKTLLYVMGYTRQQEGKSSESSAAISRACRIAWDASPYWRLNRSAASSSG
jgi:hypothetical protein